MQNYIFDVGAYNGIDGLALAINNKKSKICAFEANPALIKIIYKLKKKLEKRLGIKINNYKIYNYAVSNKNKISNFYIAKNPTVSSLKHFSNNIDKTWPGFRDAHCQVVKKIKIRTITLDKFCKSNRIKNIQYLHIDTQGNDLNVLKGLKSYISNIQEGVLETPVSKKVSLYKNNHTLSEVKNFLKKNDFIIKKIEFVDEILKNEANVFFSKKKLLLHKVNTNYKPRYFYRVLDNRTYLKDDIQDFFKKIYNQIFNR